MGYSKYSIKCELLLFMGQHTSELLVDILAKKLVCSRSVFRLREQFSHVSPDDLLTVGGDVTFMEGHKQSLRGRGPRPPWM